jgi:hypothetical protein
MNSKTNSAVISPEIKYMGGISEYCLFRRHLIRQASGVDMGEDRNETEATLVLKGERKRAKNMNTSELE